MCRESSIRLVGCLSALVALLCACGGRLPHATYTAQPSSALLAVTRSPPPARVEVVPARPKAAAVWVDGEWVWRRGRWAWRPGQWVIEPPGETFSPWVFVRANDGSLWYAPGTWRDAKGDPVAPPPAIASAAVDSSQVVNSDGSIETTGPTLRPARVKTTPSAPAPTVAP